MLTTRTSNIDRTRDTALHPMLTTRTSNIDRTRDTAIHPMLTTLPYLHHLDSAIPAALRECHASGVETVPCLRCQECHASAVETVPRLCRRDSAMPLPIACLHCLACRTSTAQPPMPLLSTHAMPPLSSMACLSYPAWHTSAAPPAVNPSTLLYLRTRLV
ncbi:hypothetical protein L211DRAFT_841751 [Terfezia boudieri ATCC MYA-4762]|uniref:Uncharacterized protein n=1 Tax=Terfezia boudieri ATCC MYA-4762 TaxID=1051890 RepID=A0A3N4LFD7_9PEZI|nr:hypothetical protein L211DRAFT_841751 [Terfezia boudieri ATCC MYA-4762]